MKCWEQERETRGWVTSRFVRPAHTDRFIVDDDDMDSDTATESDISLKSRSFLNRVNDRLRKILDHSSKDAMQDIDKALRFGECLVFDIGSICIHG